MFTDLRCESNTDHSPFALSCYSGPDVVQMWLFVLENSPLPIEDGEYCLSNDGKICKHRRKRDIAVTFCGAAIIYKVSSAIAKRRKYEAVFQLNLPHLLYDLFTTFLLKTFTRSNSSLQEFCNTDGRDKANMTGVSRSEQRLKDKAILNSSKKKKQRETERLPLQTGKTKQQKVNKENKKGSKYSPVLKQHSSPKPKYVKGGAMELIRRTQTC